MRRGYPPGQSKSQTPPRTLRAHRTSWGSWRVLPWQPRAVVESGAGTLQGLGRYDRALGRRSAQVGGEAQGAVAAGRSVPEPVARRYLDDDCADLQAAAEPRVSAKQGPAREEGGSASGTRGRANGIAINEQLSANAPFSALRCRGRLWPREPARLGPGSPLRKSAGIEHAVPGRPGVCTPAVRAGRLAATSAVVMSRLHGCWGRPGGVGLGGFGNHFQSSARSAQQRTARRRPSWRAARRGDSNGSGCIGYVQRCGKRAPPGARKQTARKSAQAPRLRCRGVPATGHRGSRL